MPKIDEIKKKSYFEEINIYDKQIIWNNRYMLSQDTEILSKLLSCVDYSNQKHLIELEKILEIAKLLDSTGSMELLGGKFMHESIRNFAVKSLKNSPLLDIQEFLYELIHGLRYEINHDNELARFLLEKAINYPVTIGHTFYWILKSQMYEQNFQQRYGLYLEIFLNKIGANLAKIFFDEDKLLTCLEEICEGQKNRKFGKKEKQHLLNELVNKYNQELSSEQKEVSLPLNFKYRVNAIDLSNCKCFEKDLKNIQLLLNFKNVDPLGDNILVNYYNDQDIRMNLVTMQLFNILNTIWNKNDLRLKMSIYKIMTTSRNKGLIQLIPNSIVFDDIHVKENKSGYKKIHAKTFLRKYLTLYSGISQEEFYENFITSNVAYCVANYVLGITQRTKKNLSFKNNGEVFYTQYEHLFNHYSKMYGDRGLPFIFNTTFVDFLKEKEKQYKTFKELLLNAYVIVRRKNKEIIGLMDILLSSGLPEISQKSLMYLGETLALNKTEEEAKDIFYSIFTYISSLK